MNPVAAHPPLPAGTKPAGDRWSRPAWCGMVALIFAVQIGCIFLLGTRTPVTPRPPAPAPTISLAGQQDFLLAELIDPSLFILPGPHGFSGAAWALTPRSEFVSTNWSESFHWLPLSADQLGDTFRQLTATGAAAPVPVAEKVEARIAALETTPLFAVPTKSAVHFEGGLAGRELRVPLELPSWSGADVLADSVVRLVVDASGAVVSAVLLESSGLNEADQRALELARDARLELLPERSRETPANPQAGLVWGRMVFDWRTIPLPNTEDSVNPVPVP